MSIMKSELRNPSRSQHLTECAQQTQDEEKDKIARGVWIRLSEIYGGLFSHSFGDKMPKPWRDMINTLSLDEIAYGLKQCQNVSEIPNLARFKAMCKACPSPDRFVSLPSPPPNLAAFNKQMQELGVDVPPLPNSPSEVRKMLIESVGADTIAEIRNKKLKEEQTEKRYRELKALLNDPLYIADERAKKAEIAKIVAEEIAKKNQYL